MSSPSADEEFQFTPATSGGNVGGLRPVGRVGAPAVGGSVPAFTLPKFGTGSNLAPSLTTPPAKFQMPVFAPITPLQSVAPVPGTQLGSSRPMPSFTMPVTGALNSSNKGSNIAKPVMTGMPISSPSRAPVRMPMIQGDSSGTNGSNKSGDLTLSSAFNMPPQQTSVPARQNNSFTQPVMEPKAVNATSTSQQSGRSKVVFPMSSDANVPMSSSSNNMTSFVDVTKPTSISNANTFQMPKFALNNNGQSNSNVVMPQQQLQAQKPTQQQQQQQQQRLPSMPLLSSNDSVEGNNAMPMSTMMMPVNSIKGQFDVNEKDIGSFGDDNEEKYPVTESSRLLAEDSVESQQNVSISTSAAAPSLFGRIRGFFGMNGPKTVEPPVAVHDNSSHTLTSATAPTQHHSPSLNTLEQAMPLSNMGLESQEAINNGPLSAMNTNLMNTGGSGGIFQNTMNTGGMMNDVPSVQNTPTTQDSTVWPPWANDPPLLEELEIDVLGVFVRSFRVLFPAAITTRVLPTEEKSEPGSDLAGPVLFCLALGTILQAMGKAQFGYIYGFGLTGCSILWLLLSLMCERPLSLDRTIHILGYGLPPIALPAVFSCMFSDPFILHSVGILSIAWATVAATLYCESQLGMREQRYLIGYPIGLFYASFCLMAIF